MKIKDKVSGEAGHAGTKYYRIADILLCKAEDRRPAELIITNP